VFPKAWYYPLLFLIYTCTSTAFLHYAFLKVVNFPFMQMTCFLYRTISSAADYVKLQEDIDQIYGWSATNLMTLNVSKCKWMLISRKWNASSPPMHLNNHQLENVQCYKYLGLLLSSDLSWSHHIETTCTKAKKLLGLLYRQFYNNTSSQVMAKLYLSFVRPHLEYGAQVWHPHLAKDTSALEKVQKFGLRICSRNWMQATRNCWTHFSYLH